MNALLQWIDERTGLVSAVRSCEATMLPRDQRISQVFASTILFTFIVEAITGVVLWMFYSPSAQSAWESVYYIQYDVAGGWLLRAVHHYAAQVLVALLGLYVLYLIFSGRYRAPREFVYWSALFLGMFSLGLCLTGDLLPWDQNSYSATLVRTKFLLLLPGIGSSLFKLAAGGPGPGFGHLTVTRFFALHAGVFTALFAVLLVNWIWFRRRARPAKPAEAGRTVWYWPNQAVIDMVACLGVLVVVGLLIGQHTPAGHEGGAGASLGVPLGAPADSDPSAFYAAARPEWSFRGLYQFSNLFPGNLKIMPIFVIPGCLVLFFLAMPIIGRVKVGHLFNQATTVVLLGGIIVLSFLSYKHDADSPEHQLALAEGRELGQRARVLALSPTGIPANGALSLLRDDPKTQGALLFQQHCASCHSHTGGKGKNILVEKPSAPNLGGFATAAWLNGLLDPKKVAGPEYFGNTSLKEDDMAQFVQGALKELRRDEDLGGEEALQKLIACLEGESKLTAPRKVEAVEGINEDTAILFEDFTCTECHKFYGLGNAGVGPDLTGYGSREWLIGVIADPTHSRFYGDHNDRMPSYYKSPEEQTLTPRQIEMIADWLHGVWYEPKK